MKVRALGAIAAAAVLLTGVLPVSAGVVRLAEGGRAKAEIVIDAVPTKAAQLAALELQAHLKAISGADFAVVKGTARTAGAYPIFVGAQPDTAGSYDPAAFSEQGYVVDVSDERTILLGRDSAATQKVTVIYDGGPGALVSATGLPDVYSDRGTLNAAYDFLRDRCGIRWLDCTEAGTVVPSDPSLSVETGVAEGAPFMRCRDASVNPEEWTKDRSPDEYAAYRRTAYPRAHAATTTQAAADVRIKALRDLFALRLKLGGVKIHANHSFYWCYDRFWDSQNANFIAFHPEYFAKYLDKTQTGRAEGEDIYAPVDTSKRPSQMCFSNEGFLRQTIEDVRAYFDVGGYTNRYSNQGVPASAKNPVASWGKDVYCLEPMDNSAFCECEACRSQYRPEREADSAKYSDYWFTFVNKVARAIRESHPGKQISTLAYGSGREGLPSFPVEDNVVVHFCWSGNRCPHQVDLNARQTGLMRRWREAYPNKSFGLWLYGGFPHESGTWYGYLPVPGFFGSLFDCEMKFVRDLDMRECTYNCGLKDDFEFYLGARLMWNPNESYARLKDEFFSSYGPAADAVRRFYDIVESRFCDTNSYFDAQGEYKSAHVNREISWGLVITTNEMERLAVCMAEGEAALATATEQERARFANWKSGYWDYMRAAKTPVKEYPAPAKGVRLVRTECYYSQECAFGDTDILETEPFSATTGPGCKGNLYGLPKGDTALSFRAMTTDPGFNGFWNSGTPSQLVYRCNVRIGRLKRLRLVTNDPSRSRFFFNLVGWRGREKVTILEGLEIRDAFVGQGRCVWDLFFEPEVVPCDLDAIGIEERYPEALGKWLSNSPRYIRIRAADWENGMFDVNSYVQSGLVVQLDGVRNAGPAREHDSAATVWKDIKGKLDFTLKAAASWGADHLVLAGLSAQSAVKVPAYGTVEAVVTPPYSGADVLALDKSGLASLGKGKAPAAAEDGGRLYALRLYSRELTPEESAYNACIDRIRFAGADPALVDWPDGYRYDLTTGMLKCRVTASCAEGCGSVSVGLSEAGTSAETWTSVNLPVEYAASAAPGWGFCHWLDDSGTVVSGEPTVRLPPSAHVTAVFVEASASAWDPPFPPLTEGLVMDLDASIPRLIATNRLGNVTNWTARFGDRSFVPAASVDRDCPPCFGETDFAGRGAVRTGLDRDGNRTNTFLWADAVQPTPVRTHMVLWMPMLNTTTLPGYTYGYADGTKSTGNSYCEGIQLYANNMSSRFTFYPYGERMFQDGWLFYDSLCNSGGSQYGGMKWKAGSVLTLYPSEASATGESRTRARRQVIGNWQWHANYHARSQAIAYGEVVNWTRKLSEAERLYMECWLTAKWTPQLPVYEWTGGGDGTNWNRPANWKGQLAPTNGGIVVISAPAKQVKVAGDVRVDCLFLRDVPSLAVSAGSGLEVSTLLSVKGKTAVSAAAGARLAHGFVHKFHGSSVSFALTDATLSVETPSYGNQSARTGGKNIIGAYPDAINPHETQAGPVTGTGRLVIAVGGTHRLSPDFATVAGLKLSVASGTLDLNGCDATFATVEGNGVITNSASSRATLTVSNSGEARLMPLVSSGIDLAFAGGGRTELSGGQVRFDGCATVRGSALAAAEGLSAVALTNGIAYHLDASRPETIMTNGKGRVCRMLSCSPERMTFGSFSTTQYPLYSATGLSGRPALMFAVNDAGAHDDNAYCALKGDMFASNRTLVVVLKPFKTMPNYASHGIVCCGNLVRRDTGGTCGTRDWYGLAFSSGHTTGSVVSHCGSASQVKYRNGVCLYDGRTGLDGSLTNVGERVQVIVASNYDPGDTKLFYNPCIGSILNLEGYAFGGALSEVIAYDRPLAHEEIRRLSAHLMRKWGAEPIPGEEAAGLPPPDALPPDGTLVLDGATLDLGGFTNLVKRLEATGADSALVHGTIVPGELAVSFAAGASPKVGGDADWQVGETALVFDGKPKSGPVVRTAGEIRGPLAEVRPAKYADRVAEDAHSVWIYGGLQLLIR